MENLRCRVKIELITNEKTKEADQSTTICQFQNHHTTSEQSKDKIFHCLNRPIYAGFSISEISNVLMYSFYYNFSVFT